MEWGYGYYYNDEDEESDLSLLNEKVEDCSIVNEDFEVLIPCGIVPSSDILSELWESTVREYNYHVENITRELCLRECIKNGYPEGWDPKDIQVIVVLGEQGIGMSAIMNCACYFWNANKNHSIDWTLIEQPENVTNYCKLCTKPNNCSDLDYPIYCGGMFSCRHGPYVLSVYNYTGKPNCHPTSMSPFQLVDKQKEIGPHSVECPCIENEDGLQLPVPGHCNLFYICSNLRPYVSICPTGQWFDILNNACVHPSNSDCKVHPLYKPPWDCNLGPEPEPRTTTDPTDTTTVTASLSIRTSTDTIAHTSTSPSFSTTESEPTTSHTSTNPSESTAIPTPTTTNEPQTTSNPTTTLISTAGTTETSSIEPELDFCENSDSGI